MDEKISIFGDSISTYEGYNPEGYAVYYNKSYKKQNRLTKVSMTWWARVIRHLHGTLLVNNSYSGSRVSGKSFPSGTSSERIRGLGHEGKKPDIILLYLGFNDFGYSVPLKAPDSGKSNDLSFFEPAYNKMLKKLKKEYPGTKIMCGTLMQTRMKEYDGWGFPVIYHGISFESYNEVIRNACRSNGLILVDLASQNTRYETLDGTHPDNVGHKEIAKNWIKCLSLNRNPSP